MSKKKGKAKKDKTAKTKDKHRPRAALRPNDDGTLDDVYIDDVKCFRLEQMDTDKWWMCCYMEDSPDLSRFDFWISRQGKRIVIDVTDIPGHYTLEKGSIGYRDEDG